MNKVRDKETNEYLHGRHINFGQDLNQGCLVEKANIELFMTTELKRILSNAVVRYCISIGKQPCLKEWSLVTHPLLKSSFIDDGKPIRQKVHFLDIKWD